MPLCRNCGSDKHRECCQRCGKLIPSRRRDQDFCSLRCEAQQKRDDEMAAKQEAIDSRGDLESR